MNTKLRNGWTVLRVMVAVAAVALLAAVALPARAQVEPLKNGLCLSNAVVLAGTSTNPVSRLPAIPLTQHKGLALMPYYSAGDATNTGNIGLFIQTASDDSTNFVTTKPLVLTTAANGATAVRDWYYWPATTLNGARWFRIGFTNATVNASNLSCTNVAYFIPN